MKYRREIDGLRAIAVLPVIFFHAGLGAFSGGYVGVDVFFVISGYLITSLILAEQRAGTFSLLRFYERRARRILPALFVMVLICTPVAWLLLLPRDLEAFAQSLVAVATFSSNVLFSRQSGYFGTAAELKPLLHTWSLAVEEQYYVLFPVFLLLTWRLGRKWTVGALIVAAIASLAAAQWGSLYAPTAAFYLLPTRGWELLIGALVASCSRSEQFDGAAATTDYAVRQAVSLAGLLLIFYSVFAFSRSTPFLGLYALVPTLGTALVILFATPETGIGKLLGSAFLVRIGLISYSAYLWHYPLFAFARHRGIDTRSAYILLALGTVTFLLAYLSWKYVETPFRDKRRFSRREVFSYGVGFSSIIILIGLVGHQGGGFDDLFIEKLSKEQQEIYSYTKYDVRELYRERSCLLDPNQTYLDFAASCQGEGTSPSVLIWGDSHAAALSVGLRSLLPNVIQYTAGGCPPMVDAEQKSRPNCKDINVFVMREIARMKPPRIVLHANWLAYKEDEPTMHISRTIESIRRVSPHSRITIVGGVPQWQPSLPELMLKMNVSLMKESFLPTPVYADLMELDRRFDALSKSYGTDFVSAVGHLCRRQECRAVIKTGNGFSLTAWDDSHLTQDGSRLLAEAVVAKFHP